MDERSDRQTYFNNLFLTSAEKKVPALTRLTICRMRNRRFSKDIRAINFRFRKEDPQKVNKQRVLAFESR